MSFPAFFDQAPVVRVRDPLAQMLGVNADGIMEYRYVDAVRLAGHSCPTVAGAFLTGRAALKALYPGALPERGGVAIYLPAAEEQGTTGVVAQVLTLLTGASAGGGFKGIGGRFARNGLLQFGAHPVSDDHAVRFERRDTGAVVEVCLDANTVPVDAAQRQRMKAVIEGHADSAQIAAFGHAWQERVRSLLLEHADDCVTVRVTEPAAKSSVAAS